MRPHVTDTSPEAERAQIQLLRRSTPTERAVLALSLSQTVLDLARRGLRAAHPDASEDDLRVLFVEIHYGRDLADQIRTYLAARRV
jgi:hypothetical protein